MKEDKLPFTEKEVGDYTIRVFGQAIEEEELKWHFDDENRIIVPIKSSNWKIQIDESLPEDLIEGERYFIPVDVYHRVIKGDGDLEIKLYKLDSEKRENPRYARKYSHNPNFSDYMLFHLQNNLKIEDNIFRYGSDAWCDLIQETIELHEKGMIELDKEELEFIQDEPGKVIFENDRKIILNTPFRNNDVNGYEFYVDVIGTNGNVERIYFNE